MQKEENKKMNVKQFSMIGYFIKHYFNWSMDYSDLESCIEDFLIRENKQNIEALKKEIKIMYRLNDPELIREVSYRLGDRGIATDKALNMIKLIYIKTCAEEIQ